MINLCHLSTVSGLTMDIRSFILAIICNNVKKILSWRVVHIFEFTFRFSIWISFFNISFSHISDFFDLKRLKNNFIKVSKKVTIASPKFNKINFGECKHFQGGLLFSTVRALCLVLVHLMHFISTCAFLNILGWKMIIKLLCLWQDIYLHLRIYIRRIVSNSTLPPLRYTSKKGGKCNASRFFILQQQKEREGTAPRASD